MELADFLDAKMFRKEIENKEYQKLNESFRTLSGIDRHYRFNQNAHRFYTAEEIEEMKKFVEETPSKIAEMKKSVKKVAGKKDKGRDEVLELEERLKYTAKRLEMLAEYDKIWEGLEEKSMQEISNKLAEMKTNMLKEVVLENYNEPVVRQEIANIMIADIMGTSFRYSLSGASNLYKFRKIIVEKIAGARERVSKVLNEEMETLKKEIKIEEISSNEYADDEDEKE